MKKGCSRKEKETIKREGEINGARFQRKWEGVGSTGLAGALAAETRSTPQRRRMGMSGGRLGVRIGGASLRWLSLGGLDFPY